MNNPLKSLKAVVDDLPPKEQEALKKELQGQALEAFNEAKLHMLNKQNSAFLSSLLHNFKVEVEDGDNEGSIDTITHSLNEQTITINSDWFCNLEPSIRATALGEQIYHIAFLHEWRMGKRDPELYQKACDEVVRHMLNKTGFELLPEMSAKLESKYADQSVEYVYTEMEQNWKKSNKNPNSNNNNPNNQSSNNCYLWCCRNESRYGLYVLS